MKGGMQSSAITTLFCECGKPTSKTIIFGKTEISLHFGKKLAYWHITENGQTRRTFKEPENWQ